MSACRAPCSSNTSRRGARCSSIWAFEAPSKRPAAKIRQRILRASSRNLPAAAIRMAIASGGAYGWRAELYLSDQQVPPEGSQSPEARNVALAERRHTQAWSDPEWQRLWLT